nr:asparaginyl endopeptidase 1 [Tanacetum cinerariifolium]
SPVDLEETRVLEHMGSGTRWESLEDIANRIRFDMPGIKQKDTYMFFLWNREMTKRHWMEIGDQH